jgi:hypothetical protein
VLVQVLTCFVDLLPQGFPFLRRQTRGTPIAVLITLPAVIIAGAWLAGRGRCHFVSWAVFGFALRPGGSTPVQEDECRQ